MFQITKAKTNLGFLESDGSSKSEVQSEQKKQMLAKN